MCAVGNSIQACHNLDSYRANYTSWLKLPRPLNHGTGQDYAFFVLVASKFSPFNWRSRVAHIRSTGRTRVWWLYGPATHAIVKSPQKPSLVSFMPKHVDREPHYRYFREHASASSLVILVAVKNRLLFCMWLQTHHSGYKNGNATISRSMVYSLFNMNSCDHRFPIQDMWEQKQQSCDTWILWVNTHTKAVVISVMLCFCGLCDWIHIVIKRIRWNANTSIIRIQGTNSLSLLKLATKASYILLQSNWILDKKYKKGVWYTSHRELGTCTCSGIHRRQQVA